MRSVLLPSRRSVLLSDTVGFIRNLPHALVSAFRATLEEVQRAALLLEVTDVTSPHREEQEAQVDSVLRELNAHETARLRVLNKVDLLAEAERAKLIAVEEDAVYCSAAKGIGLDALLQRIDALLAIDPVTRVRLRVPQSEGKVLALLEAKARIVARRYRGGIVEVDVDTPESLLRRVQQFVT